MYAWWQFFHRAYWNPLKGQYFTKCRVTVVAQWAKAPGIHCYVAGSIPAVTPRYCTMKIEKCSLEHKKNKGKKKKTLQNAVWINNWTRSHLKKIIFWFNCNIELASNLNSYSKQLYIEYECMDQVVSFDLKSLRSKLSWSVPLSKNPKTLHQEC